DLDTCQPAADVGHEARQPFQAPAPQSMRKPVKQQRMKTWVAGDDLPRRARGRIPIENDAYFFPDSVEHKNPFITVGWNTTILLNFGLYGAQEAAQDVDFLFLQASPR